MPVELSSRLVAAPEATLIAERRTAGLLAAMAAEAQRLGSRFVACPISPRPHRVRRPRGRSRRPCAPPSRLTDAARSLGAGTIDIAVPLRGAHERGEVYYRHDFHLGRATV